MDSPGSPIRRCSGSASPRLCKAVCGSETVARLGSDRAAELLRSADGAMYAAKNAGKGRWSRFEPVMQTDAPARPMHRVRPTPSTVA